MKRDPSRPASPSWQSLLVVCQECQKRGSGPKRLKAKEVVHEARKALKAERPRPRVVTSGCLGLCPKRAIAVARVDAAHGARIVGVVKAEDVAALNDAGAARRPVDPLPDAAGLNPPADRAPDSAEKFLPR